jgi:predicted 2-oxoglutarate/Fe(II)-dependent dioxygenase YbiX
MIQSVTLCTMRFLDFLVVVNLFTIIIPCFAFSSHASSSTSSIPEQQQSCVLKDKNRPSLLDVESMKRKVLSGKVYQQEHFLNEDEIRVLLQDVDGLIRENKMIPSGLSNTNKGKEQNFGRSDRTTCPVPWWIDSLQGRGISVRQSQQQQQQQQLNERELEVLNSLSKKIQQLRQEVALSLNRPTVSDASLAHECYYSRSTEGALLKRHMDERHEETKGPRGWMLPSRRSISWLIYLSDFDVQGGELRSFVQDGFAWEPGAGVEVSSDRGNLQVGWLHNMMDGSSSSGVLPVFLDSWYRPLASEREVDVDIDVDMEPFCIMYTIQDGKQVFITKAWMNTMVVESFADFIKMQASLGTTGSGLFTSKFYAKNFKLLEDRQLWENDMIPPGSTIEDVKPKRGSLVMFDSVTVPHEVLVVKGGVRTALAGWFHEQTQPIPQEMFS